MKKDAKHLRLKPCATNALGQCATHCANAATYTVSLLFYLINVMQEVTCIIQYDGTVQ